MARPTKAGTAMLDDVNRVTGQIIDAAVKLHMGLGPGLLESVYHAIMTRDLQRRGLSIEREVRVAFEYDGMHFTNGLRLDMLVNGLVVVELKSVEKLPPVAPKQVLTYLRLLELPVGLLLNFGAPTMKEGIHRIINTKP